MKAAVLCAGYGTRLGNLTKETPKAMLSVAGHPMLEYIICHLARHGFDRIALNLHFGSHLITGYFGDGSRFGVRLTFFHEELLLGTAGGLRNMAAFLAGPEPFVVQYGDVVTDQDFGAMLLFHRERDAQATVLVHKRATSNSVVILGEEGRITGFLERPSEEERCYVSSPWVNSGICICDSSLLTEIPQDGPSDLPRDVFTKIFHRCRLFGFPLSGYRCAVDSPERLAELRAAISEKRCSIV